MPPIPDRKALAATSRQLEDFLTGEIESFSRQIEATSQQIQRIHGLKTRDAKEERKDALAEATRQVAAAEQHLHSLTQASQLWGVLKPIKTSKAMYRMKQARAQLEKDTARYDAPAQKKRRADEIAKDNQAVSEQRATLPTLEAKMQADLGQRNDLLLFQKMAAASMQAACGSGWLAPGFVEVFGQMDVLVRQGELMSAQQCLPQLAFQNHPSDEAYDRWQAEARKIRDNAYRSGIGTPVTPGFEKIPGASAALAATCMQQQPADELLANPHPVDQWQSLSLLATHPNNFKIDVQWAVYWAMFQCAQQMAETMDQAEVMEDPLNGRFSTYVEQFLSGWAGQKIPEFGYPSSTAYLGTLQLAGTEEESRLGADLGIIISLNIGGLQCQKAVLLQAKRAMQGKANLGSEKEQLPKLSRRPRAGYYLFYHDSPANLHPPVPTVSSAEVLRDHVLTKDRDPAAKSLTQDVRGFGWDWASFVGFGLCNPASSIGESFGTFDDALNILGEGDPGNLPKRVFLIAIHNDAHVRELKMKLRDHNYVQQQDKTIAQKSRKNPDRTRNARADEDRGYSLGG